MHDVEAFPQSLILGSLSSLQNFLSLKFIQSFPATRVSRGHLNLESLLGSAINLDTLIYRRSMLIIFTMTNTFGVKED